MAGIRPLVAAKGVPEGFGSRGAHASLLEHERIMRRFLRKGTQRYNQTGDQAGRDSQRGKSQQSVGQNPTERRDGIEAGGG